MCLADELKFSVHRIFDLNEYLSLYTAKARYVIYICTINLLNYYNFSSILLPAIMMITRFI